MNPADHVTNIINTDFDVVEETGIPNHERVQQLAQAWIAHGSTITASGSESGGRSSTLMTPISPGTSVEGMKAVSQLIPVRMKESWRYRFVGEFRRTWILTKRTALIIRRNVVLALVRFSMYGTCVIGQRKASSYRFNVFNGTRRYERTTGDNLAAYGEDGCQG